MLAQHVPQVDAVGPALIRQSVLWGSALDHRVLRPVKGGSC